MIIDTKDKIAIHLISISAILAILYLDDLTGFKLSATDIISMAALIMSAYLMLRSKDSQRTQNKLIQQQIKIAEEQKRLIKEQTRQSEEQTRLSEIQNIISNENIKSKHYFNRLSIYNTIKELTDKVADTSYVTKKELKEFNAKLVEVDFLLNREAYDYCRDIYNSISDYQSDYCSLDQYYLVQPKNHPNGTYYDLKDYGSYNIKKDRQTQKGVIKPLPLSNPKTTYDHLERKVRKISYLRSQLYNFFEPYLAIKMIPLPPK